jgi:NADPH-dependent glutamate synthase beta subunit-like oxidoreductase
MAVANQTTLLRFRSTRSSLEIKTGVQRYERPIYDYLAKTSPCREGCPTGHDIPLALFLIAQGRPDLAYSVFREESPFPAITGRVCYHPCESPCNRSQYDQPLAISRLERFAAEHVGEDATVLPVKEHAAPIAVIGSGPSGLSCAYHLRRLGYPVTVYESAGDPGGALRYGVPAYRLPRPVLDREIARLEALGVVFRCGVRIGDHVGFGQVREQYAAVFLGVGLSKPRRLSVPGAHADGVLPALTLLRRVGQGERLPVGRRVLVIGGGDVAVDAARVARRLGADQVVMCAVEMASELPAHPDEVAAARQEGIDLVAGWAPLEVSPMNGMLAVVVGRVSRLQRDQFGSVTLDIDRDNVQQLVADTVVYAIGQEPDEEGIPEGLRGGMRVVVGEWGDTALPGVFAGGDIIGSYNVVQALGSGKRAAIGIDLYLQKRHLPDLGRLIGVGHKGALSLQSYLALVGGRPRPSREQVVSFPAINLDYFAPAQRVTAPVLPVGEAVMGFAEVNQVLDRPQAEVEAKRCFNCAFCSMCGNCFTFCPDASVVQRADWGFEIDLDHCKGCGICVRECPRSAMTMVPEEEL